MVATRDSGSPLWSFHLVNEGDAVIGSAELAAVKYDWGEQYVGGHTPNTVAREIAPGARALLWQDDGSSEMRTDLWVRIGETWLLFEFPRLYRQQGTSLTGDAIVASGPPG